MISNLFLSIFALYFYFQHRTNNKKWSLFFLFMGLSAFVGGIYHGFPDVGEQVRFFSWSLFSGSLIFAQLAAYQYTNNLFLKLIFISKSILFLIISIQTANFSFMVLDTAISMLGFIVVGNSIYLKSLSKYITYGILISFASAFFVIYKISFSDQYLNYNDIGHYISIISLIVMSKGIRLDSISHLLKKV
ncbi:MAG: hypothetical protein QM503_07465 [Bacteroidota bacterium]